MHSNSEMTANKSQNLDRRKNNMTVSETKYCYDGSPIFDIEMSQ